MIGGLAFALVALLFLLSLLSSALALGALAAMGVLLLVSLVRWEVGTLQTSAHIGPAKQAQIRPVRRHAA